MNLEVIDMDIYKKSGSPKFIAFIINDLSISFAVSKSTNIYHINIGDRSRIIKNNLYRKDDNMEFYELKEKDYIKAIFEINIEEK